MTGIEKANRIINDLFYIIAVIILPIFLLELLGYYNLVEKKYNELHRCNRKEQIWKEINYSCNK